MKNYLLYRSYYYYQYYCIESTCVYVHASIHGRNTVVFFSVWQFNKSCANISSTFSRYFGIQNKQTLHINYHQVSLAQLLIFILNLTLAISTGVHVKRMNEQRIWLKMFFIVIEQIVKCFVFKLMASLKWHFSMCARAFFVHFIDRNDGVHMSC